MSNVSTALCMTSSLKSHLILRRLVHNFCRCMLELLSTDDVFQGLTCVKDGNCNLLDIPKQSCASNPIFLTCSKVLGCLGIHTPANENNRARGTFLSAWQQKRADILHRGLHCVKERSKFRTLLRSRVSDPVKFRQNSVGTPAQRRLDLLTISPARAMKCSARLRVGFA